MKPHALRRDSEPRMPAVPASAVVPAPRGGRLVRRSLGTMVGSVVARRYHITDTIGAGGMGSVYEAVDLQTGSPVALKALRPGAYDPVRLKRLRREARTMTAVRSEHVCQVHYLGVERGTPFIVMERLHGETLRTRLREQGPLPIDEAVAIAVQLLDALSATHEAGIVHRDVKPSNVFLTQGRPDQEDCVKLIDFGLAKLVRSGGPVSESAEAERVDDDLTSAELVAGTLHYLAPEQLLAVADLDERVDVYAAGVTLFEMLTGHRAYQGTYSEVVHDIILSEPPTVSASRPDLPSVFDDVLAMAMAKSRDRRFASAKAFKRALLAAYEDVAVVVSAHKSGIVPTFRRDRLPSASVRLEDFGGDRTMVDEELPTLRPPPMARRSPETETTREEDDYRDDVPTLRPPPIARIVG
jgi:eukaryotic-like serine/threonine-protein kinase